MQPNLKLSNLNKNLGLNNLDKNRKVSAHPTLMTSLNTNMRINRHSYMRMFRAPNLSVLGNNGVIIITPLYNSAITAL